MPPKSKPGPAPAQEWGRAGLALAKQSGEAQAESKVAGKRLQAAACSRQSDPGSHAPEAPARPTPVPGDRCSGPSGSKGGGCPRCPAHGRSSKAVLMPARA